MEEERYRRHTILPGWAPDAQARLQQAEVLMVGAGGLGCPTLQYLVAAGIGTIHLFDNDVVSESNLARQILYFPQDIGKPKVLCAADYLQKLNPKVLIIPYTERVTPKNLPEILPKVTVVIDGSDNFYTRYWVNDACVVFKKPLVYGAVYQYEGQLAVLNIEDNGNFSSNLRDLFPEIPAGDIATCAEAGVLNALTGIIGSMMAAETIKIITKTGSVNQNRLIIIDMFTGLFRTLRFTPTNQKITFPTEEDMMPTDFCKTTIDSQNGVLNLSPAELVAWKKNNVDYQLVDVRSHSERLQFSLGGIHCPMENITDLIPQLNPKQPTIFYCHSGQRSRHAAEIIAERTNFQVYNLSGGIIRFKSEYPQLKTIEFC